MFKNEQIYTKLVKFFNMHRGRVVKGIIKRYGFSLAFLAKYLRISRSTLYNRLGNRNLSYEFIMRLGDVISFDFSSVFPALSHKKYRLCSQSTSDKDRYICLLERYIELLSLTRGRSRDDEKELDGGSKKDKSSSRGSK